MESEKVEIFQDENQEHTWWVVEGDSEDPQEAKFVVFSGPMAKSRAEGYAALQSRISFLEAFWNWSREADRMQFEAECKLSDNEHTTAMEALKELEATCPPDRMLTEKGWAVWSPALRGILPQTTAFQEETAINRMEIYYNGDWKECVELGYRAVEVTISYKTPGER